jgi:hypothetical protein
LLSGFQLLQELSKSIVVSQTMFKWTLAGKIYTDFEKSFFTVVFIICTCQYSMLYQRDVGIRRFRTQARHGASFPPFGDYVRYLQRTDVSGDTRREWRDIDGGGVTSLKDHTKGH